ncbi:MAG: AMP-binding protein [Cyanobacteria bacterium]|nr:AMP-binding protein [Cyanobacteriota bacterium]
MAAAMELANLLDRLRSRPTHLGPWIWGADGDGILATAIARSSQLQAGQRVLIARADPGAFLRDFLAATAAGATVILADPRWSPSEQAQAIALAQPEILWSDWINHHPNPHSNPQGPIFPGAIAIPTGGSSGQIKFALHDGASLGAAVAGFCGHFAADLPEGRVNSLCTLPLHHVSGLMQLLRCARSGGCLALAKRDRPRPPMPARPEFSSPFLSLVPTQLARLLADPGGAAWLRQFQTVLLGGAPPWPDLLDRARQASIRLAPTYGMTETAAQVATLHPQDFLAGAASTGPPLPHATVIPWDLERDRPAPPQQPGAIAIQGPSLFLGYLAHPDDPQALESPRRDRPWLTDDLGYFDHAGHLHLLGRRSHTLITGGEKVHPQEVEAALLATGLVKDACVIGLPDRDWGQAITATYVPSDRYQSWDHLRAALRDRLSPYKCPKYGYAIAQLPRNAQGKIERSRLLTWLQRERESQQPHPPPASAS